MTKLKTSNTLDSVNVTKKKIQQWKEKNSISGVASAWELKRILNQSMFNGYLKEFVKNISPKGYEYEDADKFWAYGFENLPEDLAINIMLTVVDRELELVIKQLSNVRMKRYLSGYRGVFDKEFVENVIVNQDNICIVVTEKNEGQGEQN